LLYADDTIILSDDEKDFQRSLNAFDEYCTQWKLNANNNKTKIIIFGARNIAPYKFYIGRNEIEIVKQYKYLGVIFSANGSFLSARQQNIEQAKKAMHLLYIRANNSDLPLDLTLKLFDHTIVPILTYGCEIWGYENLDIIERVHREFLRKITMSRKSTPSYMLYGELGRYPLHVTIYSKMIGFWSRTLLENENKYSKIMYINLINNNSRNFKWISKIKQIFDTTGKSIVWHEQNSPSMKSLSLQVKRVLIDQYIQQWHADLNQSNKGKFYNSFKNNFEFENYLKLLPKSKYVPILKLRTANHHFPIETGRWNGTPELNRLCTLCNEGYIGNEEHYILNCTHFTTARIDINMFSRPVPTVNKLKYIMTTGNVDYLHRFSKFANTLLRNIK